MFSLNHFIWLGICILVIVALLIINKKFNLSFDTNVTILFITAILSETIKISNGMTVEITKEVDGVMQTFTYLDQTKLPFHLCSIQIFFILILKFVIKNESTKEKLLAFMCPTMLLGGILAIFIPTEGVEFNRIVLYEYFLFHAIIIYFAIYLLVSKKIKITWSTYIRNCLCLIFLSVCAIWINSILQDGAVNFFFVSRPPMDNLPLLNLNHGWGVYYLTLLGIGIFLMSLFHLPFILTKKKTLPSV